MQSPHTPVVVDSNDGSCHVECPQCRTRRPENVPIGIGLPMYDRITAELLAENHRADRRTLAAAGTR